MKDIEESVDNLLRLLVLFGNNQGKEARIFLPEELLDAEQVAKILKVHPRTVKRLASQRVLRGFQVAGKWRFRPEAVEEYIKQQEEHGSHPDETDD